MDFFDSSGCTFGADASAVHTHQNPSLPPAVSGQISPAQFAWDCSPVPATALPKPPTESHELPENLL